MRRILPLATLALTIAMAGGAQAGGTSAPSGNAGTNVGDSMREPMVVTTDNGNVREQPNAQAKLLTTVPRGQQVTMIGTANGGAWAHVMVNGLDGYMDLVQLQKAQSNYNTTMQQSSPRYMAVSADSANVREQPTNESRLLATLPRGTQVNVVGMDQDWARVEGNGFDGYVDNAELADVTSPYGVTPSQSNAPSYQTYSPSQGYQAYPTTPYSQTTPTYQYQGNASANQYQPSYQYQPNGQGYGLATRMVNGGGGTIHQSPDPQSPLLGIVPPGGQVSVVGMVDGNWAHVVANGTDGYMSANQLQ